MANIKPYFIGLLIISIISSGIIGAVILILGNFGDIETKILGTTILLGVFSLIGLAQATLFDTGRLRWLTYLGFAASITAFIIADLEIWGIYNFGLDKFFKVFGTFAIIAFSIAHMSLILLIRAKTGMVAFAKRTTILFIGVVAAMLIYALIFEIEEGLYIRLTGVAAIVDVVGTIVTPLLAKISIVPKVTSLKKSTRRKRSKK